jgi:hypothetical protein
VYATAVKVLDLLSEGKRVVCCSSTKKFTRRWRFIASASHTRMKVYNASTVGSTDLRTWTPSGSSTTCSSTVRASARACRSFQTLRLWWRTWSTQFTPGVETGLQQLFRVRRLRTGHVSLSTTHVRGKLPCSMEGDRRAPL